MDSSDKTNPPKDSGFVRAYINTFLLENVEFFHELLLRSEEEYRFYMEQKKRTGKAMEGYAFSEHDYTATLCHKKIVDSTTEISDQDWADNNIFCGLRFEIEYKKVVFEDGWISVLSCGHISAECSISDFSRHPNATFRRLMIKLHKEDSVRQG